MTLLRKTPRARYLDHALLMSFARARVNAAPDNVALRRDLRRKVRECLALRRAALLGWMPAIEFDKGEG